MGQEKFSQVNINDYLAIEREDHMRYEFHEGNIFAMAGGIITHTEICTNVVGELRSQIRSKKVNCKPFGSEMKVEVIPGTKYVYPDAGVSCPDHNESKDISGAITNPRVVVEVTSPSSGDYDRGNKLRWYFSLPSVMEYVMISQDEPLVMLYRRHGHGELFGLYSYTDLSDVLELKSIGIVLPLSEIYYGLNFNQIKV